MEKLEIGSEQKLHEGRPHLAQSLPSQVPFSSLFNQTFPCCWKRKSFMNDVLPYQNIVFEQNFVWLYFLPKRLLKKIYMKSLLFNMTSRQEM